MNLKILVFASWILLIGAGVKGYALTAAALVECFQKCDQEFLLAAEKLFHDYDEAGLSVAEKFRRKGLLLNFLCLNDKSLPVVEKLFHDYDEAGLSAAEKFRRKVLLLMSLPKGPSCANNCKNGCLGIR